MNKKKSPLQIALGKVEDYGYKDQNGGLALSKSTVIEILEEMEVDMLNEQQKITINDASRDKKYLSEEL